MENNRDIFPPVSGDKSGRNGLNLLQGEFRCDIRKEILIERALGHSQGTQGSGHCPKL